MDRAAREELSRSLGRLKDGDRGAFDLVFARVFPLARRFALVALKNSADAEDVAQTALLRVFSRAHEYDETRDALAWIAGITAFEIKTRRRQIERRRESSDVVLGEQQNDVRLEDEAIIRELLASLRELLGTLSRQDEEAILAAAELCPRPKIAAATFRKRLERATSRLKQAWRTKHGVE